MLFCSRDFLFFFAAVFAAYWSMPSGKARLASIMLATAFLVSKWNQLHQLLIGSADCCGHGKLIDAVSTFLAGTTWQLWLAVIIISCSLMAFRTGHHRGRVWLLVMCSFCFYASFNHWLAMLIFLTTCMDYLVALGMQATASQARRRLLLILSLVANLGLLVYFKYANFFLHSLEQALRATGSMASLPVLSVILPIGISFYTFEAINYTVDVYRGRTTTERNLGHFLLFITFFPHLVAGPIVRARDFLPQIYRRKRWDWARLQLGAQFFLMGLFKKMAIADRMAMFADPVFKDPSQYSSHAVWVATLAYAIQIYCDFSGYTDMALGAAHMLGYKLAKNFDMPYLATNIAEFWRRWHISLSTWLRDYLFIPLGGSRGARWQTCRNLLITMTLGGLWHMQYDPAAGRPSTLGALFGGTTFSEISLGTGWGWLFVIWGVLHGCMLIVHRYFKDFCKTRPRLDAWLQTAAGTLLRVALTFTCVMFAWVLFRANTCEAALEIFHRLLVPHAGGKCPMPENGMWILLMVVVVSHLVGHFGLWKKALERLPAPALGFSYAFVLTAALVLAPDSGQPFIYFQF